MRYLEDKLQMACRHWFDLQHPRLALLLHHSPNEGRLMHTARDGAKRKAMGVRAGFPDFILLYPSGGYPYLAIELKSEKGRQSPAQREYQEAVQQAGGLYILCRTLEEFREVINAYIGVGKKQKENEQ